MQVLQPAIELAEGGFAVGPLTAHQWKGCVGQLKGPGAAALKVCCLVIACMRERRPLPWPKVFVQHALGTL